MGHNFINNIPISRLCVIVLSVYASTVPGLAEAGEVAGLVWTVSGKPIVGAHVYALLTDAPNPGRHTEVITDAEGKFVLKAVRPGQNEIHAYAPEAGYPDDLFAVFQTAPVATVNIKDGDRVDGIIIQLGPKPGTLSGEIVDALSHSPLPAASVTLSWADRPEYYVRSSVKQDGRFAFTVPVRPLLIDVTCTGYRPWKSERLAVPSEGAYHILILMTK